VLIVVPVFRLMQNKRLVSNKPDFGDNNLFLVLQKKPKHFYWQGFTVYLFKIA